MKNTCIFCGSEAHNGHDCCDDCYERREEEIAQEMNDDEAE